ncbi:hypothetical protein LZ24_02465 [Desulfobotulus alkaliphilus]|uniref:Uncharacterized protein n=1 Tax=Desulfobotulus alkaliphilus TaxID=622671 RepID=A0A562RHN2_9BACT|nr:hypothetical protein [Desulfobotulus alkaliphilus]TWI68629.1 hypothetical protein LZ24_02465 [Desulfobotulus alkaliphilus]
MVMRNSDMVKELDKIFEIVCKYENHISPVPEKGRFYSTYNGAIAFVFSIEKRWGRDAEAVILRSGDVGQMKPGDQYDLGCDGKPQSRRSYIDFDLLGYGLHEKLDVLLP